MSENEMKSYMVHVLGCKVNQYDARQIERLLDTYGLRQVDQADDADIVVVHTCAVTAAAAQKSRQTIRRMQRDNPLAQVVVTGCAADIELTRVDQVPVLRVSAGADWLQRLAEQFDQLLQPATALAGSIETDDFAISSFGDQTRSFLKVQDGCDIGCSFCIIPQLRKEPRDKRIEAAVAETKLLIEKGCREIVVTGVSVGLYGRDSDSSLAELLRHLVAIPDVGRLRMSSLHPGELTDERSDRLHQLGQEMALAYHSQFIGKEIDVLVESARDGLAKGYSAHYIPVQFETNEALRKQVINVKVTEASASEISGVINSLPTPVAL